MNSIESSPPSTLEAAKSPHVSPAKLSVGRTNWAAVQRQLIHTSLARRHMKAGGIHHRGMVISTDPALYTIFWFMIALIFCKVDMLGAIVLPFIFTVVYTLFIKAPGSLRQLLLWLHIVAFVTG